MVESHLKDHPTLGTAWQTVPDGLVSKKKIEYLLYKDQAIVHPDLQYIQSAHTLTFWFEYIFPEMDSVCFIYNLLAIVLLQLS